MPKKPAVHTVPGATGWTNKQNGQPISNHSTKAAAQAAGRLVARQNETEHVIHKSNGQISEKNSYGNDPNPPRDKNK